MTTRHIHGRVRPFTIAPLTIDNAWPLAAS